MLTCIQIPEALLIAEKLKDRLDWKYLVRKLSNTAKVACTIPMTKAEYFQKGLPCPFLDLERNECTVYQERPSACRYYYTISPPGLCAETDPTELVTVVNLFHLEAKVWKFGIDRKIGIVSPLPLLMLWALWDVWKKKPQRQKYLRPYLKSLPTPVQWMRSVDLVKFQNEDTQETQVAIHEAARTVGL